MEKQIFFDKYQPQTKAEWCRLVQHDLKNGDFSSLQWHTAAGVTVQPYYTTEDLKGTSYPGYIYATKTSVHKWQNLEKIAVKNDAKANKVALDALNAGADGVIFEIFDEQIDLNALLQNILLQHCGIYFSGRVDVSSRFLMYCKDKRIDLKGVQGGLLNTSTIANIVDIHRGYPLLPFKLIFIAANGERAEEDPINSLKKILFQIVDIVDKLTDQGIEAHTVLQNLIVEFNTTNSYYFEICKIRAFKLLLAGLAQAYNISDFNPETVHIHHQTSPHHGEDDDQNMVRNTSQAMSAILGGCDSLYIAPHDHDVHSNFSRRIARNISLILKEEAYFDKVSDPAAGSYFFESLTKEITEKVWNDVITSQKKSHENRFFKNNHSGSLPEQATCQPK